MWLSYPPMIALTKTQATELPFCVLLFTGVLLILRSLAGDGKVYRWLTCGGLLALASIIRPAGWGVPLVLALAMVLSGDESPRRKRFVNALLLLLAATLVILPWELLVRQRTGQWIFLSSGGVPSMRDGLTFAVHPGKAYRQQVPVPQSVRLLQERFVSRYSELTSFGRLVRALYEEGRDRPGALLALFLIKAGRAWYGTDSGRREKLILAVQSVYLLAVVAGTLLLWRFDPTARWWVAAIWLTAAYFWVQTVLVLSIARYMVPAMGLLFVIPAAAVGRVARAQRGGG